MYGSPRLRILELLPAREASQPVQLTPYATECVKHRRRCARKLKHILLAVSKEDARRRVVQPPLHCSGDIEQAGRPASARSAHLDWGTRVAGSHPACWTAFPSEAPYCVDRISYLCLRILQELVIKRASIDPDSQLSRSAMRLVQLRSTRTSHARAFSRARLDAENRRSGEQRGQRGCRADSSSRRHPARARGRRRAKALHARRRLSLQHEHAPSIFGKFEPP